MDDRRRELIEERIEKEVEKLESLPPGSKEAQLQADVVAKLMDAYTREEAEISNWFDKQENRRIDEEDKKARLKADKEKNKRLADIEEKKTKLTPGKVMLEIGKVVVPAAAAVFTTLLCIGASKDELDETLRFEETGRINSSGGRSHKRPSFWNKR